MRRFHCFLAVFVLAAALGGAPALGVAAPYIDPQLLSPLLLPPPPVEGGAVWRDQVAGVIAAQKRVSPEDIAAARDEQRVRVEMMAAVMGAGFTREKAPKAFALLEEVLAESLPVIEADKKFWRTRRPYLEDRRVRLYVDPLDASPAYPSGHTAASRLLAEVMGMIAPDRLAALRARADAIAWHRVEAGVHYPNDLENGRMLAMILVGAFAANREFADDLAAAREEYAASQTGAVTP